MVSRTDNRIKAEAAAWLARLGADERSAGTEQALRAWLAADPAHVEAFEKATDLWEMLPGAAELSGGANDNRPIPRRAALGLAASILLCIAGAGGWYLAERPVSHETMVGEQQVLTLADGSRVTLNTDSRIAVDYEKGVRRIRLDHGEALFEVARNKMRPFIVETSSGSVTALGTKFVVRELGEQMAVTLIEGKVAVSRTSKSPPVILKPGQRLTLIEDAGASIDAPPIEAVTAWRRGEAMFDDISLIDAAAELNRYGTKKIIIDDPSVSSLRVSGVFATSDADEFARAIAALHGLKIEEEGDTVHLRRETSRPL
jgi:transmembrane sensor